MDVEPRERGAWVIRICAVTQKTGGALSLSGRDGCGVGRVELELSTDVVGRTTKPRSSRRRLADVPALCVCVFWADNKNNL